MKTSEKTVPDLDQKTKDPHAISGLLKLFLRMMPDPLLTFALYDRFISAIGNILLFLYHLSFDVSETETFSIWGCFRTAQQTEDLRIAELKQVLTQLPEKNRNTLQYISHFLTKIRSHSEVNLMSSNNLAIVFSPNILAKKDASMLDAMMDSKSANEVVTKFIDSYSSLFCQ